MTQTPRAFDRDKQELIDHAFARHLPRTMADLGGVWNVGGAYSFYAVQAFDLDSAVIVDTEIDDAIRTECAEETRVTPILGQIGDPTIIERVGSVDAILLFDVLLHQVAPDWDEILEAYAPHTSCFVIYNPQWVGDETVRLIDLGHDEYFASIPHDADEPDYDTLFDRLDEPYPAHDRLVRDVHYIWQWGIADADLRNVMTRLGFTETLARSYGPFGSAERFQRRGFVFVRDPTTPSRHP